LVENTDRAIAELGRENVTGSNYPETRFSSTVRVCNKIIVRKVSVITGTHLLRKASTGMGIITFHLPFS